MNRLSVNPIQETTLFDRYAIESHNAGVLADIYQDNVNIAIWKRSLRSNILKAAERVLNAKQGFLFAASVTPKDTFDGLYNALGANNDAELISADVTKMVDMFCCLFDLKQAGLRLTALESAMCPRFHVDRVPCRLVTTYSEIATQWLAHQDVDRSKLGTGNKGKSDEESGIYQSRDDINQLSCGQVALLKGESWLGNVGGGLVHRSPSLGNSQKRLLLTLDFN